MKNDPILGNFLLSVEVKQEHKFFVNHMSMIFLLNNAFGANNRNMPIWLSSLSWNEIVPPIF